MIRSFLRRLSFRKTLPGFFRIPALATFASHRRGAILTLIVLALATFGGYAAIASSSTKSSPWQQLVNRSESFTKIFASRTVRKTPAARTISGPAAAPLAPTAVTLSWNTFGNLGTETTEPSTANDPNVSSTNLTLGSVTPAANGNRFGGNAWFDTGDTNPTTLAESIAGNDYIQFIVTPNAGFSFTPTSLVFIWDRSGTGPSNVTLRSSADGFSTDLGTVTGIVASAFASNTITISGLTNLTTATTFRLYGYGATAAAGTGGFDINTNANNVVLNGTTTATSTPPTITAGGPLTRQQGSAASNSTIATVSDTSAGTLTVTATTIPTGITVTNIVNSGGMVTADVSAGCDATIGANTVVLTVMNGTTGLSNTANLTVNVTANTPPTLTYGNATVAAGGSTTVTPATGPSDNGSVSTIAVQNAGTYTGTISVDNTTGVVSISNAGPPGMHTITIRATDNCGSPTGVTDATFTLTVGCPTLFTVNDLGDAGDVAPGNGFCATSGGVCTLRAAIEEANALEDCAPLTINFSVTGTINVMTELPWVEHPNLTIQGPGANLLDVHRDNSAAAFTVFIVTGNVVTINDLTVSNGDASGTFGVGGGIYGSRTLTINRCHITGNTADQGGGLMNEGGDVFINDSTISNNTAGSEGGGVYNAGNEGSAAMTLTNCTLSGNSVTSLGGPATAGGLANFAVSGGEATANLINCTITGNTAASSANAGGIFSGVEDGDSDANINLKNTILAGNSDAQALTANGGLITSQGNNLDSNGSTGFTNGVNGDIVGTVGTPVNALLAALGNYGGTTPTHALLPGSPAINNGTFDGAPATDQRGITRPQQTLFDIGAFESQGFTLAIAGGNNQSTVVSTNFAIPLSVTVTANDSGVPVDGGVVTFTPPSMGASASLAVSPATISGGTASSGTVTANAIPGTYNVSADTNGAAAAVNFSLTNTCQTITVTNPVTNTGTVGTMFSATFTQMGGVGMTTFSTSSTLPTGLMLSGAGVLSGTPTQAGSFPITVVAMDANGCTGMSVGYTLTIACPVIKVDPATLPNGVVGTAYSQTITPSGGTTANYTYSFTGTLPPGLMLSLGPAATGSLSGNPTASGSYNFTVTATDANGCTGSQAYSVTINQAPTIISANTTTFTVNALGAFTVTTTGFPTVTSIMQSGALPANVTFTDNGNGTATLSGTPQTGTNGNYPLIFTATNGISPNASQNFTLVVSGLVCPSTLTVNDLGDAGDANPGDGICLTSGGVCTLRAAIQEANAIPACTPLTINFSVTSAINLATELPALAHPNLTIQGPGASQLTVQRSFASGTPAFRIFTAQSGTVSISGLTIANGGWGFVFAAGILAATDLTLDGCVVMGNNAVNAFAGGIGWVGGVLTIRNSTIAGNFADNGGAIYGNGTRFSMSNSTVSGNTSVFQVAGLWINPSLPSSLTNVTISDNTTGTFPNALLNIGAAVTLTNCTVANNSGAVGLSGLISLQNTIVANNGTTNFSGPVTSLGNNLSTASDAAILNQSSDLNNTDPLLAPLGNYGGPTPTRLLLPGSPAIDKGGAGVTTDQRGLARPFDFPAIPSASGGNNSDIGAVEVQCSTITLTGLPGGTAGVAYTQSNLVSGGTAPYTLSVTSGALPTGVTTSGNGLTGTPAQPGTFSFTLTATDAYGCTGSQSYIVSIVCPTITLSPAALPNAMVNVAYPQTITASPVASYTFSVTGGVLPSGLTLNPNGSFSGAPTQSGVFNFRVTATAFGSCSTFTDYTLLVNCTAITVNPSSVPGGTLGMAYSQSVSASPAGVYFYSVTSGALPTGLTLNGATGAITGTPTNPGLFTFTVSAASGGCSGSRTYTVEIICQGVSITPASLPAATAGNGYSQTISVSPAGSYTFSLAQGNLPSGLTLHPTTGVISGLPAVVGTVSFIVKVSVPNSCSTTQAYTLTTNCPPAVTISPASLPNGAMGTAYSQTLSASPAGGNYMYTLTSGSLPTGLTLNSATGVLSGTPTANGSFTFIVTATGFGSCAGSKSYTVVIGSGGCPTITLPASLPSGSTGQFYNSSVAASPAGSYSYTFTGSLPPGVTLYSSLGVLLGYPTANGTYNFTVTATGASNCSASQSYSVVIGAGSLQAINDFSGDRKSDFVLWRSAQMQWLIVDSATNIAQTVVWGEAGDRAVSGDFDGDGKADLAGFGKDGHWRIKLSGGGSLDKVWGLGSDAAVPGDYDGDGKTDLAVWRGAAGGWYIQRSSDGQTQAVQWGMGLAPYLDVPVPGDYDGDGKTDLAVFRQANGHWYIRRSSDGQTVDKAWGLGSDVPVPGDYDGDGQTDIAVWRGSEGDWHIVRSSDGAVESKFWGAAYAPYFDAPAVGDYDGDGKADVAVWRKSEGRWYVQQSSDGATRVVTQGRSGDSPIMIQSRP